jgi:hypothetical protein
VEQANADDDKRLQGVDPVDALPGMSCHDYQSGGSAGAR